MESNPKLKYTILLTTQVRLLAGSTTICYTNLICILMRNVEVYNMAAIITIKNNDAITEKHSGAIEKTQRYIT